MRAARLVTLLLLLQQRGLMSAAELSSILEVSPRTVYRDIEALSGGGIPIYAERGTNGGFGLLPGHRVELGGLTDEETRVLPLMGLPGLAHALRVEGSLRSATLRIRDALTPAQREIADAAGRRLHIDVGRNAVPRWLDALQAASISGRTVHVSLAREEIEQSAVAGLVWRLGQWHAVLRSERETIVVRVDDIERVRAGSARRAVDETFDVGVWWEQYGADTETPR